MNKNTANGILVNFDMNVVRALEAYVQEELEIVHRGMETQQNIKRLYQLQGRAVALKNLLRIRTDAEAIHKQEGN